MLPRALLLSHSFIIFLAGIRQVGGAPAVLDPLSQWKNEVASASTSDSWQQYVRSPPSKEIPPLSVLSNYTQGNVTNPNGLLTPGGEPTILTRPAPTNTSGSSPDVTPVIVLDFGQNIAGYLSINFAGASNSTPGLPGIRLAFSESIAYGYLTNVSDFSRSDNGDTITPGSDQIAVEAEPYTWTDVHGCEYGDQVCADGIHGFRYLKIYLDALPADAPYTSSYGEVSIDSLSLNYTAFLGTPDTFTGYFESSDDQLNQWWYDAVYTVDLCTVVLDANSTDPRDAASPGILNKLVLIDGAKRDRLPYTGDLAVSARTSYLTHDVPQAARNVLEDIANHQRADGWLPPASMSVNKDANNYTLPLLDYPLWWVANSYDLLMYTGDTAYFDTYYQTMVNVLDNFYPSVTNPATQLITKGFGVSGSYGDYAFLGRTGPVTYFNVLYVLALDNAASIAQFLGGHDDDVARWTARAQNVSAAVNSDLFDAAAGAYYDGACGFSPCQTHAQDGNALSIVSGTANTSRAESVLSYIANNMAQPYGNAFYDNDVVGSGYSTRVYAFISYFELEARFITGLAESALEEIRRLYGWMTSHDPSLTMWEGIGADGLPYEGAFTSMAHGWSTGIVPALSNYVLGVIPTGPGFSAWSVKPMPGDVTWAKGQVPTPNGPINVFWYTNADFGLFFLNVNSPAGTTGTISVPVSNSSVFVWVDSQPAWNGQSQAYQSKLEDTRDYVSVQVQGGNHTITVGYSG